MTAQYTFDPSQGRFTAQAFVTGLLAALGHNPTFAIPSFTGSIRLGGPNFEGLGVDLSISADSLELIDKIKIIDKTEIIARMKREVLETGRYPRIEFATAESEVTRVDKGQYNVFLGGRLTAHGESHQHGIDAELLVFEDGVRLRGRTTLKMSHYGIKPVTALGGAIKLKDEMQLTFDLVGLPEAS